MERTRRGFVCCVRGSRVCRRACGELTGPDIAEHADGRDCDADESDESVTVSWTPSPLNDGVISYSIFRNGDEGRRVDARRTYLDTGLSPQTTYVYSVAANCVGGVVSERSVENAASTVTTTDLTPPTVIQTIPAAGAVQASPSATAT